MDKAATEYTHTTNPAARQSGDQLRLEREDVGQLDKILRGYYLGQIRQLDSRRERRKARILIENHLVLPKSRQRTSKDAAYIQEKLDIDEQLLDRLEESRLIRRLNQSGRKPIYEISHDTLVEPILAERNNREAVILFVRKYGRWFALLLLLLFTFGMLFENWFDVMDDSLAFRSPSSEDVRLEADGGIVAARGTHKQTLLVPFADVEDFRKHDSLTLLVDVNVTAHPDLDRQVGQDTIVLNLGALPLHLPKADLERLLTSGRDTAIPIRLLVPIGTKGEGLLADVAGTTMLRLQPEPDDLSDSDEVPITAAQRTRGMPISNMVEANFGRRTVRAGNRTRTIALDTIMNLSDMVGDDQLAQSLLKDKTLRLTYQVDVAPAPPPTKQVEYMPVSGIEVEYSDGTRKYIPGDGSYVNQPVYHTVQPGETLFKISRLYDVTTDQIRQINQLSTNNIRVGQVLRVR